jgi:sugar phosphate isomerase/epimerase
VSTPQMSVQLYSVREALDADPAGTLERLAGLGLRNAEAFDFVRRAPELAAALGAAGIAAPTGHAPFLSDELRHGDSVFPVPAHAETFAAAAALGMRIVIDPFVAPDRWADRDEVARTADRLNAAAAEAAEHGLRVGYHNHAHEFAHSFDGVSAYEYFAERLDDAVALELDAYWAAIGGQDVAALAGRLGSRLVALHVKDGSTAEPDAAPRGQVPAGEGDVPLTAVLDAAPGLEYAVLEFDAYDGDIFEALGAGVRFLGARGIR